MIFSLRLALGMLAFALVCPGAKLSNVFTPTKSVTFAVPAVVKNCTETASFVPPARLTVILAVPPFSMTL